jgi:large subunit ribosomal protein L9
MKLILQEDVKKLGSAGEVVDVKDGYGRNYLIPQGKARIATESKLKEIEEVKRQARRRAELTVERAKEMANELEKISVTLPVKTGEEGKIFGTVTNQDIADALEERGFDIDKRKISVDQDVNELGEYTATVDLIGEIKPTIKVWVVKGD